MTREQCLYLEDLCHSHKIGYYREERMIRSSDGDCWAFISLAYYSFSNPNMLVMNADMSVIFLLSLEKYTIDSIKKGSIKNEILNEILDEIGYEQLEYFKRKFFANNPNYSKYRKIWRKYKNKWFKKFSYKSVPKEIYYEWQTYDRWFYTKKEIREILKKYGKEDFDEKYSRPNIVGFYFDGEKLNNVNLNSYTEEEKGKMRNRRFECSERNFIEYKGKRIKYVFI